jgi:hypothetical protein
MNQLMRYHASQSQIRVFVMAYKTDWWRRSTWVPYQRRPTDQYPGGFLTC